jgi:hypothetical protein
MHGGYGVYGGDGVHGRHGGYGVYGGYGLSKKLISSQNLRWGF